MDEFRVKVTVKNNLLASAIEDAGYAGWGGITRCAKDAGIPITALGNLVNLKLAPLTAEGEFSRYAKAIMELLGAAPSDLWTTEQLTMSLEKNSAERSVSSEVVKDLLDWRNERLIDSRPEDAVDAKMRERAIREVVKTLTRREEHILTKRFGLGSQGEMTLEEVALEEGITRERVRQIEQKAMRKMRHPSFRDKLQQACDFNIACVRPADRHVPAPEEEEDAQ